MAEMQTAGTFLDTGWVFMGETANVMASRRDKAN
jgi:hypothetical protein